MAKANMQEGFRERLIKAKNEIEQKNGKSLAELYDEKDRRIADAYQLKMPDRVPVTIHTGVFAARYIGLPLSSMYYDQTNYRAASLITALEFDADTGGVGLFASSGLTMELLDTKTAAWPGGTLPPDTPYQFIEGEYMKAEEYDLFLNDPSDFMLRYYLPRVYGLLAPLPKLPPIREMFGGMAFQFIAQLLASPEFRKIGEAMIKIDEEQKRLMKEATEFAEEMVELGFPPEYVGADVGSARTGSGGIAGGFGIGVGGPPFDVVSDFLRGMRGTMLDMKRCPDKLLAACDKIFEWRMARAVKAEPDTRGNPRRVMMPLHRGSDGFMSTRDFEKFYWPGLKRAIVETINLGCIAAPFWEGIWDERLEYLLELPKGKVVFWTENTDIFRAKEILGDHMCIQGGMPPTLLQVGSTQDIEEYCKKLINVVGKNGGFVLGPTSAMDYAKPENVKTMIETVKKYGGY